MMTMSEIDLPPDLVAWVEGAVSSRVVGAHRHFAGASGSGWSVDVEDGGGLFLVQDRNDRGGSGRDAAVLRGLAGGPVPVPTVFAHDADRRALLLERLPGTSEFPCEDDAARNEETARALMRVAAELHALDPKTLYVPHLEWPDTVAASVEPALEAIQSAERALPERLDPFLAFARRWLEANRPEGVSRVSLVHSDLGPGNFLHDGGRITGVVDWEVAHLGDPMEDLAALAVRDMATPVGALADRYREYAEAGGGPVDLDRVRYFQLLVLSRNSALIRMGIESEGSEVNAKEMTMFETLLLRGAALVLCDAVGVPRPAAEEAAQRGAEASTLRTADREELSALLGRPISKAGIDAAMGEVARGAVGLPEATRFFARHAHRRAEGRRDLLGPLLSRFPQTMPSAAEVAP